MIYNELNSAKEDLQWIIKDSMISSFLGSRLSTAELHDLLENFESTDTKKILSFYTDLFSKNGYEKLEFKKTIEKEFLPCLAFIPGIGIALVYELLSDGRYKASTKNGEEYFDYFVSGSFFSHLQMKPNRNKKVSATTMFKEVAYKEKKLIFYAAIATLSINILALATSLYSMQVYDRVIPTGGLSTLIGLSIGVFTAIFLEMIIKLSRATILDFATKKMDLTYSHDILSRFFQIRCDRLPKSIGTLSGQLQSYGAVRSFITSAALYLIIDFPFTFVFLFVIMAIGGWKIGLVVILFLIVSIALGFGFRKKIDEASQKSSMASHKKMGLLVEIIENGENIKSSGASWNLTNKWNALTHNAIDDDVMIRHYSDMSSYITAFFQQISYVCIVALGAYIVSTEGTITMGALIAMTILSGRVLAPVAQLPGLFVQWGKAKLSVKDLDNIYKLNIDNEEVERALSPTISEATLTCHNVNFGYMEDSTILNIKHLSIKEGEKVAILGVIGCGKSTLLKILSGLYRPTTGHTYLANVDIQHISRDTINNHIAYLPQSTKLLAGTLRDNLTLGLVGISDDTILEAAKATGLINLINALPNGLDMPVPEGGESVSGGQKQLIALTRMVIANKKIWLLDEPTASMDEGSEKQIIHMLLNKLDKTQTLVVVTHKPVLLNAVDRIIVLTNQGIVMDGPKELVLEKLRNPPQPPQNIQSQGVK